MFKNDDRTIDSLPARIGGALMRRAMLSMLAVFGQSLGSRLRSNQPTDSLEKGRIMKQMFLLAILVVMCFLPLSGAGAGLQDKQTPPAKSDQSAEMKPGKEKGKQERFFAFPLAKVKEAVIDAMKGAEFEVKKDSGNELEAKRKRHVGVFVGSGGETLVAQFKEAEEGGVKGTRVVAETKKGFVGRAGQKSWTNAVLDEAERILKEAKQ